jgi:tRNA-modifying protein YgfZ
MTAIPNMDEQSLDAQIPWHYGDPFKEQRNLVNGIGQVDLSNRGVVTVTGQDRLSWLNSLTTQDLLTAVKSTQALILSPHGHIEHDLHLIDDGETTWLIIEPDTAELLVNYLNSMKFMLRVEVTDRSDEFAVVGSPNWIDTAYPTWHSPEAYLISGTDPYVPSRPHSWAVTEFLVNRSELTNHLIDPIGSWAWEAHRIRAGVARLNFETDHKTIPNEIGLIGSAVHLNKGCYRGQETVARVINLGKPPRRLVHLELDGSTNELPARGAEVFNGENVVGRVTSVIQDYESGPVALAVIKRTTPVDATLTVAGISAAQTPIVIP